jgi:hypothetical protein
LSSYDLGKASDDPGIQVAVVRAVRRMMCPSHRRWRYVVGLDHWCAEATHRMSLYRAGGDGKLSEYKVQPPPQCELFNENI